VAGELSFGQSLTDASFNTDNCPETLTSGQEADAGLKTNWQSCYWSKGNEESRDSTSTLKGVLSLLAWKIGTGTGAAALWQK